jgi:hypothetical protein
LPLRLSYFSERLELPLRWSASGRRTRRRLVIPTRRCTPGGTRGAPPYAATGTARPAARAPGLLARIVSGARRAARTWTRLFRCLPPPAGPHPEALRRARDLALQAGPQRSPTERLARWSAGRGTVSAQFTRVEGAPRPAPEIGTLERAALAPRLRSLVWAHCRGQPSRAAPASFLIAASRAGAALTARVLGRVNRRGVAHPWGAVAPGLPCQRASSRWIELAATTTASPSRLRV